MSLLRDIVAAIDETLKTHGQHPVIVGSSAGCQAVLRAALERADLIYGLVLFSPGVGLDLGYMDRVLPGSVENLKQGHIIKHPTIDPNLDIRVDLTNLMDFVDNCPTKLIHSIPLNCPIRIVHGLKDRLVPYANSLKLLSLLESQYKSLMVVNDGHFIKNESTIHESISHVYRIIQTIVYP